MWKSRKSKGDVDLINVVCDHIEKYIGKIGPVLHEKVSPTIHVDINVVLATDERPFHTLVTSGMAELPMPMPTKLEEFRFAELMICLPKKWPIEPEAFQDENNWWPIRLLKGTARFPHDNKTWLYWGHTVSSGSDKGFAPNTQLNSAVVTLPKTIAFGSRTIPFGNTRQICLWGLVPLYEEELAFKLENGFEELDELLDSNAITELLNPERKSVIRRASGQ